jgi:hypothetical protein
MMNRREFLKTAGATLAGAAFTFIDRGNGFAEVWEEGEPEPEYNTPFYAEGDMLTCIAAGYYMIAGTVLFDAVQGKYQASIVIDGWVTDTAMQINNGLQKGRIALSSIHAFEGGEVIKLRTFRDGMYIYPQERILKMVLVA